jgi:hypothetical protein
MLLGGGSAISIGPVSIALNVLRDVHRISLIRCSRKNSGSYGTGRGITTVLLIYVGDRDHDLIGGG